MRDARCTSGILLLTTDVLMLVTAKLFQTCTKSTVCTRPLLALRYVSSWSRSCKSLYALKEAFWKEAATHIMTGVSAICTRLHKSAQQRQQRKAHSLTGVADFCSNTLTDMSVADLKRIVWKMKQVQAGTWCGYRGRHREGKVLSAIYSTGGDYTEHHFALNCTHTRNFARCGRGAVWLPGQISWLCTHASSEVTESDEDSADWNEVGRLRFPIRVWRRDGMYNALEFQCPSSRAPGYYLRYEFELECDGLLIRLREAQWRREHDYPKIVQRGWALLDDELLNPRSNFC